MIKIPYSILVNWNIEKKNILQSTNKLNGKQIFKFCYHPLSGEFLVGAEPASHKEIVSDYGIHRFESYVRGIWFCDKKAIYLRMHETLDWLDATKQMLINNGVPKSIRIIWGEKAAKELAEELRGL